MRVLIAPQEFKGSLTAEEAANAIADGLSEAQPGWEVDLLPMADGGPGFIDAMRRAIPCDEHEAIVAGPLGAPVTARYLVARESGDIFIEAAQANGLLLVAPEKRDALRASTHGVGQLLAATAKHGAPRIIIGVGGSATTDGGAGMAAALGARFRTETGEPLPTGGGSALLDLARIDWSKPAWLANTHIVVATDVTNPLLGPNGASAVYSPQKGASAADVDLLEAALSWYAAVVRRSLGVDVARVPGGGAAGGLAAGLIAFLGATVVSGFDVVSDATGLPRRIADADLVITGEGRFDSQSAQGKTTGRILEMAQAAGKPVAIFAGATTTPGDRIATLASLEPDPGRSMANAGPLLRRLAAEFATDERNFPNSRP